MPDTGAQRQARWRQRRQDGVQRELCPGCGRHGAWGQHAPWHRACWELTPAGLEANREAVRRSRKRVVTDGEEAAGGLANP